MTSLKEKVREYLRSPKGKETVDSAKRMASDPQNQQKAKGFFERFRSRRH